MSSIAAFLDGVRRIGRAVTLLLGVYLALLLFSLPLAAVVRGLIAGHLGASLAAERAASGVNWEWWQEFSAQATGLGATFTPDVLGFAAVLGNLSDLLDNRPLATVMAGVVGVWLVFWSFLAGGILDRLARDRRLGVPAFNAACGRHVGRLWRLGLLALVAYGVLFGLVHGWLFDRFFPWATRDFTVERSAFLVRVALYLVFGALLVLVNVVVDYARIRLVVEDRRSAVMALLAAGRFVRRHAGPVAALYLLNGFVFLLLIRVYAAVAPGAGTASPGSVALGLLVTQLYLVARLAVKLQFYASQVAFFQGRLAHAGYVAVPVAEPGEPPVAETIRGGPGGPVPPERTWG